MRKPYIGITGFMTKEEVAEILKLMPPSSKRLLMVGILASWKTLYESNIRTVNSGQLQLRTVNKAVISGRYPSIKNISEIFIKHPLALNLIHYDTINTDNLCEQLLSLTAYGGRNLHGFQLNLTWPPVDQLKRYRSIYRNNIIVMVITPQAFEDARRSPRLLVSRIKDYKGLIDYVLLDRSGGCGISLDTVFMREYLHVLYAKDIGVGFSIAGGLSEDTLYLIEPLVKEYTGLSFDAEDKLRNSCDDSLNLDFAKSYIYRGLKISGCIK